MAEVRDCCLQSELLRHGKKSTHDHQLENLSDKGTQGWGGAATEAKGREELRRKGKEILQAQEATRRSNRTKKAVQLEDGMEKEGFMAPPTSARKRAMTQSPPFTQEWTCYQD